MVRSSSLALVASFAASVVLAAPAKYRVPAPINKSPTFFPQGLDFLLIGDWGSPADKSDQYNVAQVMEKWAVEERSQLVISLGDNFYVGGNFSYDGVQNATDPKFNVLWRDVYQGALAKLPWWMTMGNHDWYIPGSNIAEVQYGKTDRQWYLPDYFYTKRVQIDNGAHATFVFVETDLLNYGYNGKSKTQMKDNFINAGWTTANHTMEKQLAWVDKALEEANKDPWVFVIAHHPTFTCGDDVNGSANMTSLLKVIDKWHPTAYINGHHHTLAYFHTPETLQLQIGSGGKIDAACAPLSNNSVGFELANTYGFGHAKLTHKEFRIDLISEADEVVLSTAVRPRKPVTGVKADTTWAVQKGDPAISVTK
ncbi:Tartrate-resistant acid phosphatase type 5 [Borealophlyctis nickersoniae]|nr:Tartrate-resistant acid phosphatase type 5 [Borealophlyctis nickersoniae]